MSIFQKSILNSIKQDESLVAFRWAAFQNYIAKIDAIRGFKEEVYQDGFFKDIFESCLGYTLKTTNPADYNLEREKKNETDGKKADGVIYVNGEIIGVVELKDQKTKNLDAVESQAFNYHASHSNSKYIIISNFDELRFYIDKKTAYEKFSFFSLTYEDFKTLHLLISFESIRDNIPLKLKEKSLGEEQRISKELYRDFSQFRTHLFENIVKNNYTPVIPDLIGDPSPAPSRHPELDSGSQIADLVRNDKEDHVRNDEGLDKQTLLRLTQKLCDRIIFILFAEDRGLLHANTIKEIREHFKNQAFTTYTLYDIYKFYFQAINEGNSKLNIPKYNGGLFATDALLDSLIIDDAYLDMEAQKLSDFDFVSEISVNILGHIFEQSLTDLEEINASINDTEFDKKKSKRKKDGVFYTPEYITRYIVENTLGKLCETKKKELFGCEALASPINPKKLTKDEKETLAKLYEYRDYLLNLKILDPACGSGAFLNQALEFLIREHKNVDDYRRSYENEMLSLYDIEANILEHNLYGVDINEDAVEIARLSLWLRTAQSGRTLTNLSDKIKCGNSLIADKSVAENAFVWEDEFPEVFNPRHPVPLSRHPELDSGSQIADHVRNDAKMGFDVVIGNPPYVRQESLGAEAKNYFAANYATYHGMADLYNYFYVQSFKLLKQNGYFGFISSSSFFKAGNAKALRVFLTTQTTIQKVIDFGDDTVFDDATTYPTVFIAEKAIPLDQHQVGFINFQDEKAFKSEQIDICPISTLYQTQLDINGWKLESVTVSNLRRKITQGHKTLKEIYDSPLYGIKTGLNEAFVIDKETRDNLVKQDPKCTEIIKPFLAGKDLGRYKEPKITNYLLATGFDIDIPTQYPTVYAHLLQYETALKKRSDKGKEWYNLRACAYYDSFLRNRIIYPVISQGAKFCFLYTEAYSNDKTFILPSGDWYLLGLLNSKLVWFFLKGVCSELRGGEWRMELRGYNIESIPIAQPDEPIKLFIADMANNLQKIYAKLNDYNDLLKEYEFKKDFENVIALKKEIEYLTVEKIDLDSLIDRKVYEIYELSVDEIAIVEGNK